ncbi:winged helix-turn-helix transcriptional regulator [Candidatus Bathyarchaeota archaeon A05DMB-2]|nr:winged helix-turn-helix transcriptional regulator [Candidatus Bathyarchaeota archaeon A05DMB-2]
MQLLLSNSRLSYRELEDTLNLSVTAVHKRIQDLTVSGVIRKFTAKISLFQLDALHILIFGNSKLDSMHTLPQKFEKNGRIYWLSVGRRKPPVHRRLPAEHRWTERPCELREGRSGDA